MHSVVRVIAIPNSKKMGLTLCHEMEKLNVEVIQQGSLTNIMVETTIRDQVIAAQKENKGVAYIKERVRNGKAECFTIDDEGVLWFKDRLVVPKVPELRQSILEEAHATRLSIHPGSYIFSKNYESPWSTKDHSVR